MKNREQEAIRFAQEHPEISYISLLFIFTTMLGCMFPQAQSFYQNHEQEISQSR